MCNICSAAIAAADVLLLVYYLRILCVMHKLMYNEKVTFFPFISLTKLNEFKSFQRKAVLLIDIMYYYCFRIEKL